MIIPRQHLTINKLSVFSSAGLFLKYDSNVLKFDPDIKRAVMFITKDMVQSLQFPQNCTDGGFIWLFFSVT